MTKQLPQLSLQASSLQRIPIRDNRKTGEEAVNDYKKRTKGDFQKGKFGEIIIIAKAIPKLTGDQSEKQTWFA